jgi:hypothetical protein
VFRRFSRAGEKANPIAIILIAQSRGHGKRFVGSASFVVASSLWLDIGAQRRHYNQ